MEGYNGFLVDSSGAMERANPNLSTSVRPAYTDETLLVSACGRTCQVDMASARSLEQLQQFLQRALQMDGQEFQVCDINGALLTTDMQVQDAITQGLTPLCATLPDKSLHHLENRREELAQMQWKLVRDQVSTSTNQFSSLTRQLSDFQLQFQTFQREVQTTFDSIQQEMVVRFQDERQIAKSETNSLQEAVNGMSVLISTERNKRELSVQGFEKHIHGVCDMVDSERAARRQELVTQTTLIEELKAFVETEKINRERTDQNIADLKAQYWQLREELICNNNDLREQIQRVKDSEDTVGFDISARFSQIEDRYSALENNAFNSSTFSTQTVDNLTERQERISQSVESVRLNCKYLEGNIGRIQDLENAIKQNYIGLSDRFTKEKSTREDEIRRTSQNLLNDSRKQIAELEKRLTVRLERESADREKNFKSMIDEVSNLVDDRKLFREPKSNKVQDVAPSARTSVGVDDSRRSSVVQSEAVPLRPTSEAPSSVQNGQQRQMVLSSSSSGAIASMLAGSVFGTPVMQSSLSRLGGFGTSFRAPVSSTGHSTPRSDRQPIIQQPFGGYVRSASPVVTMGLGRSGSFAPSSARSSSPYPMASSSLTTKLVD